MFFFTILVLCDYWDTVFLVFTSLLITTYYHAYFLVIVEGIPFPRNRPYRNVVPTGLGNRIDLSYLNL